MPAELNTTTRPGGARARSARRNGRVPAAGARRLSAPIAHTDGRRLRGERTRMRVLEALLDLVAEGELRPTAQQVAARAGVALRTVYHHFEDVEALRRMAFDLQVSRHEEQLHEIDPSQPLADRVQQLSRQLRRLFEVIGPIRRATMFDEHSSSEMADGLRRSRTIRRGHVERTFAPEIARQGGDGRVLLDALDVATSWHSWFYLRNSLGRGPAAAEKVLAMMLGDLLGATSAGAARSKG